MAVEIPTVSKLINDIKHLLEGEFVSVAVKGEISNLSCSSAGHYYMTLSDKNSSINCAIFKGDALRNPLIKRLKGGEKVACTGSIGVYAKRGTFQLITKTISIEGKGDLKQELEKLKNKLKSEGLFDLDKKRPLPYYANRIAIITSEQGAAFQDFLNIFDRRSLWMDLILSPALVQGENAPNSICRALKNVINYSNNAPYNKKVDVIVLTRGGGSLEDLWAFNDEQLARDIFDSPIPIISAVGHEIDFSISDYVADFRCETPSAAAEILTKRQFQLKESLSYSLKFLKEKSKYILLQTKNDLVNLNPQNIIQILWNNFYFLEKKFNALNIYSRVDEFTRIKDFIIELDDLSSRLVNSCQNYIRENSINISKLNSLLDALNPNNVLDRGYCYLKDDQGIVVGNAKQFNKLPVNDILDVHFSDGEVKVIKSG